MLRTRIRAVYAVVILVLAAALALPAGVAAAEPSADSLIRDLVAATDPAAAFSDLSPAQQSKVLSQLQVVEIITDAPPPSPMAASSGGFAVLAGGCWTVTWGRSGYNSLGWELWSLKQRMDWCGNGSTITSVTRIRWVEVYIFGWSGTIIQDPTWGGVGQWSFRAYSQAHMQLDVVYPVQHAYPWLDMTVTANGGLSGSGGGG
jgi:hypothetical protein